MSELLNGTEARLICAGSTLELEDGVGPPHRLLDRSDGKRSSLTHRQRIRR
jgi:hypothetical protein